MPVVRDFLHNYLDKELVKLLDLSTLEIKKDTFVDQELGEHFSDILRHACVASQLKFRNGQDAKVYVLIEHKSYSDSLVAFQLLRYMIRILELELKQQSKVRKKKREHTARVPLGKKKEKIDPTEHWIQAKLEFGEEEEQEPPAEEQEKSQPQKKLALTPILPIIFYHGTQEWQVPLGFHDIGHACPPYLFGSSSPIGSLCAQFSLFPRHASVALRSDDSQGRGNSRGSYFADSVPPWV